MQPCRTRRARTEAAACGVEDAQTGAGSGAGEWGVRLDSRRWAASEPAQTRQRWWEPQWAATKRALLFGCCHRRRCGCRQARTGMQARMRPLPSGERPEWVSKIVVREKPQRLIGKYGVQEIQDRAVDLPPCRFGACSGRRWATETCQTVVSTLLGRSSRQAGEEQMRTMFLKVSKSTR